jgi:glycogen debranching enzyme
MIETLWEIGEKSIRALEIERGILASSKEEIYGCIFGRDSIITAHKLLRIYEHSKNDYYLSLVRKILLNLADLQGKERNIESGEEPGKIIHEFRTEKYEHLVTAERPWYVYPDKTLRNYDTVDATPLFLMTAHRYLKASGDSATIDQLLPSIKAALRWLLESADTNNDGLIDYSFHPERKHGGLVTQSWMDSSESLFFEDSDARPEYPIAPVEVQAYAFVALAAWRDYFSTPHPQFSAQLADRARLLRTLFNERFVIRAGRSVSLSFAIDGAGRPLTTPRSSMGHCLFAVYTGETGLSESVLDPRYISAIRRKLLSRDLFVRRAGVRTLSSRSRRFDPMSYHNGSIWPHDTAMLAEGLQNFGYHDDARVVRMALLRAYKYFATPIELFAFTNRRFHEYKNSRGSACRVQAWSAASLLTTLAHSHTSNANRPLNKLRNCPSQ